MMEEERGAVWGRDRQGQSFLSPHSWLRCFLRVSCHCSAVGDVTQAAGSHTEARARCGSVKEGGSTGPPRAQQTSTQQTAL